MIRIGVDLHGTLDRDPVVIGAALLDARRGGVFVFVVSGPPRETIVAELAAIGLFRGVHYDDTGSIVDNLIGRGVDIRLEENGWWTDDAHWWGAKGVICRESSIDVLIDDRVEYAAGLPEKTKFIFAKDVGTVLAAISAIKGERN